MSYELILTNQLYVDITLLSTNHSMSLNEDNIKILTIILMIFKTDSSRIQATDLQLDMLGSNPTQLR